MNIIICDKEPATRSQIKESILSEDGNVHIREINSTEDLLERQNADIIFLNIQSGQSGGIRAVQKLRSEGVNIPIIFVASTKDYVFDAFDVDAFQYLVKPIESDTVCYVYRKAKQYILENRCRSEKILDFITKKRKYFLRPGQILYAENDGKKIIIHTIKEEIVIYGTMKALTKKLGDNFYRSHRGYLVNMQHIMSYRRDSIQLDNGDIIYLSRDKYSDFVKTYLGFVGQ